jgi:nucleoid-associated protein YgaU
MGFELVRNQDRLENNEAQIRQLTTALRNHMQPDMNETVSAFPVFAESETALNIPNVPELPDSYEATETPPLQPTQPMQTTPPAPPAQPEVQPTTPPVSIESGITSIITVPHEEAALIPPIPETYTIQPGDSLLAISLHFFGDANMIHEILALNGLENPDHIIAGRTLVLPQR